MKPTIKFRLNELKITTEDKIEKQNLKLRTLTNKENKELALFYKEYFFVDHNFDPNKKNSVDNSSKLIKSLKYNWGRHIELISEISTELCLTLFLEKKNGKDVNYPYIKKAFNNKLVDATKVKSKDEDSQHIIPHVSNIEFADEENIDDSKHSKLNILNLDSKYNILDDIRISIIEKILSTFLHDCCNYLIDLRFYKEMQYFEIENELKINSNDCSKYNTIDKIRKRIFQCNEIIAKEASKKLLKINNQ
jgi:hypothetical protein